eukprot:130719_1
MIRKKKKTISFKHNALLFTWYSFHQNTYQYIQNNNTWSNPLTNHLIYTPICKTYLNDIQLIDPSISNKTLTLIITSWCIESSHHLTPSLSSLFYRCLSHYQPINIINSSHRSIYCTDLHSSKLTFQ